MTWIGQQRVQDTPGPARRIPGESVAWVYGSKLTRNAHAADVRRAHSISAMPTFRPDGFLVARASGGIRRELSMHC
jgi:hypothetical protein